MKVLWICNICLPAVAEHLGLEGSPKEGWLVGLSDTLLSRQQENQIELHVAFPVATELDGCTGEVEVQGAKLYYHGFYEEVRHAESNDPELPARLQQIFDRVQPEVIHCFGTEYQHTLAAFQTKVNPRKILVGLQGICMEIARNYMADIPIQVQNSVSFRDWLKKDSIRTQRDNYVKRGLREQQIIKAAFHITGRTEFDKSYALHWNPEVNYYSMNETLRPCFYEGQWQREKASPHTIFVSQADYPLKGLHYLLLAAGELKKTYPDLQIRVAGNSLVESTTVKDKLKISAYGRYLRQLICRQEMERQICFLGKLSGEQMKQEYLNCDLFLCCSSNENSPNSLGEAMLLGVPCVAAEVGGIPSIFQKDLDGRSFTVYSSDKNNDSYYKNSNLQKTVKSLINAILLTWEDNKITDDMISNARKHAAKTHDKEENYLKMTEIYAKIAGKGSDTETMA